MRKKQLIGAAGLLTAMLIAAGIAAAFRRNSTTSAPKSATVSRPVENPPVRASYADRQINTAQDYIERSPSNPIGYNLLASAYMQKARETGDFSMNARAQAALDRASNLDSTDYDTLKLRAKLLLTYHRFSDALEVARHAQQLRPQDHDIYAAITDALVELGDYKEAVKAAQTMVDLRPDTSSYSRVSYLRALHGDNEGAIQAMRDAADAASPQNPESMAWCRVQLGNELINAQKLVEGEREIDRALHFFPDYHLALAAKGRARLLAHDVDNAIKYYKFAENRVPIPDYAIALGDLFTKLGRTEEATREYQLVEFVEQRGAMDGTYSLPLALFWADHNTRLDEALKVAERERAIRSDIYTCDVLAWCLFKNGRFSEAKAAMNEALRLGTLDPRLFYHAGMIASAMGDRRLAANHLKTALELNPDFDILQSDIARQTLRETGG
jgi:tetratricopeptide (TPR) repeat protein